MLGSAKRCTQVLRDYSLCWNNLQALGMTPLVVHCQLLHNTFLEWDQRKWARLCLVWDIMGYESGAPKTSWSLFFKKTCFQHVLNTPVKQWLPLWKYHCNHLFHLTYHLYDRKQKYVNTNGKQNSTTVKYTTQKDLFIQHYRSKQEMSENITSVKSSNKIKFQQGCSQKRQQ